MTFSTHSSVDWNSRWKLRTRFFDFDKNLLVPRDSNGKLRSPTSLVTDAHAAGLLVHVWTFRNENCFLPLDFQGNPQGEYELFFSLGVDGVFSDYPDTASYHSTIQW
nr:glycerophosphodiester phosphodiesterase family protein [Nostoc sp. NMS7]